MNSGADLNQTITGTNNPQAAQSSLGASDSKDFQQAASLDTLQQSTTTNLKVINEGPPIQRAKPETTSLAFYLMMAVLVAITISVIVRLIRWVNAAPSSSPVAASSSEPEAVITPDSAPAAESKAAEATKESKKSKSKRRKRGKK